MINSLTKQNIYMNNKVLNAWFEEVQLSVAPACNMMCSFCSKDCDCVCNGNNPEFLSKSMTPRQAVNWAILCTNKNKRVRVIKISGPGEPLCNNQTFEVLKRLNVELPEHVYRISTNGLLLKEKAWELSRLNVKIVDVSINAVFADTISKLYSRVMNGKYVITTSPEMAKTMLDGQLEGIKLCIDYGMTVKVSAIYFPDINDEDILSIAHKCRELGVKSMCLISCYPNGKLKRLRTPDISEMVYMQKELARIIPEVEIKSFASLYSQCK